MNWLTIWPDKEKILKDTFPLFAIENLISRGTQIYDFMGGCEAYKMKWAKLTYVTLTFAVADCIPALAVTVAIPGLSAVSFPIESMLATRGGRTLKVTAT